MILIVESYGRNSITMFSKMKVNTMPSNVVKIKNNLICFLMSRVLKLVKSREKEYRERDKNVMYIVVPK